MSRFANLVAGAGRAPAMARQSTPAPVSVATAAPELEELVGHLAQLRVFNGSWGLGTVWTEARDAVKVTGEAIAELEEGQSYRFSGRSKTHPKYGTSLEVVSALPYVRLDPKAIASYMSKNFDGIGPKSAEKMVKHALANGGQQGLEQLRQQLLNEPWAVDWSPAKREGTFNAGADETIAAFVHRDLTTRLGNIPGLNNSVLKLLANWALKARETDTAEKSEDPVSDSWRLITGNPYAAIKSVPGLGFLIADTIGKLANIPLDEPTRLAALVAHALSRGCDLDGHVYLTERQFHDAVRQVDRVIDPAHAIAHGLQEETIVLSDEFGERRYYTPDLQQAEVDVAEALAELMDASAPLLADVKGLEERIQTAFRQGKPDGAKLSLDDSQLAAVRAILTSPGRLHILTGGPGCGKTALIETIVKMLPGKSFAFSAPTGKAAKVLTSRIHALGHAASTIHSLLRGSEEGWAVNREEPLDEDVLVVDEGSMPPLRLFEAIFNARAQGMHIIVVGDTGQLQSIQPGRVLADLIKLPGVDHSHLSTVHRNGGAILRLVNEIDTGSFSPADYDSCDDVKFSHGLGDARTYFPVVMKSYIDAVEKRGIENVMLMISRRQGKPEEAGWNTTYANAVLREALNPYGEKLPGSANLHVTDRIIIRENMSLRQKGDHEDEEERQVRVVNGDTGEIVAFERATGTKVDGVAWLRIKLDDGRLIDYPGDALKHLDHAYALTVHAGQGSEYQEVLAVFTPGAPSFINRSTLYTAVSRPRIKLHVFGEDAVLRKIAATPVPRRNSALVARVQALLGDSPAETDEEVEASKQRARCS